MFYKKRRKRKKIEKKKEKILCLKIFLITLCAGLKLCVDRSTWTRMRMDSFLPISISHIGWVHVSVAIVCIYGNDLFFLIRRVLSPFFSSSLFRLHCLTVCVPLCFNVSLTCWITLSFESSVHYFGRFFSAILFINQENILFLKWGRVSCNVTRKKEKSIRSLLTKLSVLPMISHNFGR